MIRNRLFPVMAWCVVFLIAGGVGGCASGPPRIVIEEAEAVLSPVMIGVGSVFMKIVNEGNGADVLIAARVAIPHTLTELHDVKDGRMVKTDGIKIPANDAIRMRPGRQHLMIFKLPPDIKDGTEIILVLTFKRSGEKQLKIKFTSSATISSHGSVSN